MEQKPPSYVRNAIRTPDGTVLTSRSVHDYQTHQDENGMVYMVDGGLDYLRRNVNIDAPHEELSVESSAPFDIIRDALEWGTYGKDGKNPLRYVKLSEMSDEHIVKSIEHLRLVVAAIQKRRREMAPSLELPHQMREAMGLPSKRNEPSKEDLEPIDPWMVGMFNRELEYRKEHGISVSDPS
jgi:hypothetical protein